MLTVTELAQRWGVHRRTVLNWIRTERLTPIRTPGGHFRIPEQEWRRYENENKQEGIHQRHPVDGPSNVGTETTG